MDPDVEKLVREERLVEAARLASDRGDAHDACVLYERACEWRQAAIEALRANEAARALDLAIEAGDDTLAERAAALLSGDARAADAAAERLGRRGHHRWAARLLAAAGRTLDAARAWERAGEAIQAAELLENAGDAVAAVRVLEAALRRDPSAWPAATALGALLARFGKLEAAARVLQRVPIAADQRREALAHLVPVLEQLGLARAAAEAAAELASLGEQREQPATPAPAPVHRASPRLFGRYDVVREVASSPSARLLECVDTLRGERVAVKVFAAWDVQGGGRDALARFEREAATIRALDHPNVVPLHDFVAEGPAIVLEWMPAGTLERLLATAGALAPARAIEIACAVLSALGEAHRRGILHRDVKPANVLFDEAGGARLADFGVAHLGDLSATATAGVFGTLAYMSPEQREGRPATARSDLYAVGVMLREMLTGERPSPSDPSKLAPSAAHLELGPEHDAVVARLTARDPGARPADAFEALGALQSLDWPATPAAHDVAPRASVRPSTRPPAGRIEIRPADGATIDAWTGRAVERIPASERTLARARPFAVAGHPALQTVLRVDRDDGTLWLEAPRGRPLERSLTAHERSRLQEALDALHAAGGLHGRVDAAHVVMGEDGAVLRFETDEDPTASAEGDRLALGRLGS